jgi:hypothetical protein
MDASQRFCRYVYAGVAICAAAICSQAMTPALAAGSYSEDAVKAAYLYRFAGYVNWPDDRPSGVPFTIGVVGSPGVARELRRLLPGHSINSQAVQVREISAPGELNGARILYVGAGHADFLRSLVPPPGGHSMLLVTDEEGGLNAGSALNFLTIDRNVRFEVSLTAADRWGLRVSSELLGVAVRVLGSRRQSQVDHPIPSVPAVVRAEMRGPDDLRQGRVS